MSAIETLAIPDALDVVVGCATRMGARRVDSILGICQMPFGYALMLDADEMYFSWLRYDGLEGAEHWNKWAVYRGAKWNHDLALSPAPPSRVQAVGE